MSPYVVPQRGGLLVKYCLHTFAGGTACFCAKVASLSIVISLHILAAHHFLPSNLRSSYCSVLYIVCRRFAPLPVADRHWLPYPSFYRSYCIRNSRPRVQRVELWSHLAVLIELRERINRLTKGARAGLLRGTCLSSVVFIDRAQFSCARVSSYSTPSDYSTWYYFTEHLQVT